MVAETIKQITSNVVHSWRTTVAGGASALVGLGLLLYDVMGDADIDMSIYGTLIGVGIVLFVAPDKRENEPTEE